MIKMTSGHVISNARNNQQRKSQDYFVEKGEV